MLFFFKCIESCPRTGNWMLGELEGALCTLRLGSILVLAKTGEISDSGMEQLPEHEVKMSGVVQLFFPLISCIC